MDANCIHCNVTLTAADVNSGWCDSCGKRLPGGAKYVPSAAKQHAGEAAAPSADKKGMAWLWGMAVLAAMIISAASVMAFAH